MTCDRGMLRLYLHCHAVRKPRCRTLVTHVGYYVYNNDRITSDYNYGDCDNGLPRITLYIACLLGHSFFEIYFYFTSISIERQCEVSQVRA